MRSEDDAWSLERARAARDRRMIVHEKGPLRTVFTPRYRLLAVNSKDPRIVEGHRVACEALRRMNIRAREAGIRFVVALIPTKERVFATHAGSVDEAFDRQVAEERAWNEKTRVYLDSLGIEYVDLLPALEAGVADDRNPYFESPDGHPDPEGHEMMARALAGRLGP